jgi:hypothetical protein
MAQDDEFLYLYKALHTLSELHRNEEYFENQLNDYSKIKNSPSDIKDWVSKNEDLGANKYVCFLIDYLDHDEEEHLNVYIPDSKKLDIYIDHKDFKNTIEFLKIFDELFWVQEILPESLDKIKKATSK